MRYILFFITTLLAFEVFPQRTVSGVIVDIFDGQGLPGVSIRETETDNEAHTTDLDGKFHITTLNNTCSLRIAYDGVITQTVWITQDTVIHVALEVDSTMFTFFSPVPDRMLARWLSVGANYEAVNSMFGMAFGNGYDEVALIRVIHLNSICLEDFTKRVFYKMNIQTDFHKDYSFGVNVGWRYPFQHTRPFSMISAGYSQYDYPSKDFIHRDVHVSAATILNNTTLTVKTGYQTLNDYHNWGASTGVQIALKYNISVGLSAGYYFDYLTCSAYLHGRFHKNISYRLAYDRIDNCNFLNIGLNYLLYR